MKQFFSRKLLFWGVATVLLAAMVCGATSCNSANDEAETTTAATQTSVEPVTVGEGQTSFSFEVTHLDGTVKAFTVKTDVEMVGQALTDTGLIAGEAGPYGLYVKTVDGETLDYDTHKKYWAFYENGSLAMKGVDSTPIAPGVSYAFRAE